jgi:putative transposase
MEIRKGHRFRLDPTPDQQALFFRTAGCVRFVWNWALSQRIEIYNAVREIPVEEREIRYISAIDQIKQLTHLKDQFPFLKEVPSHCLQQVLRDLDDAFKRFFSGQNKYPKFKKRSDPASFRFPDPVQFTVGDTTIDLPKLGPVAYRNSRPVTGTIARATVSWDGVHWHISVMSVIKQRKPRKPKGQAIGIDLGIAKSVTMSDGREAHFPVITPTEQKRLARLQRSIARCERGSKNRAKARKAYRRFVYHLTRRRDDAMHKLTTILAKNHRQIVIEDLHVKNMTASAAGTVEAPGRMVQQKAGLNRSLLKQAMGRFRSMLEYKCLWYGSTLTVVPAAYTSQRCACCGHVSAENRTTQARFTCVACGHADNADHNAARNILAAGTAVNACPIPTPGK